VLAFGNPLDVGQTVTMGIISAKGRATRMGDGSFEDFLQTDAAINRGNSGGALVNVHGELVGINSQMLTPSGGNVGLGFSIPVNMARNVMDALVKDGRVQRAKLGVGVQDISADMAKSLGLDTLKGGLVSNVEPESAAARAGVRQGDVIVEVDGRSIADGNELRNAIAGTKPGTTVSLKVIRDGRPETLKATLGELPSKKEDLSASNDEGGSRGKFGMVVQPVTPELAQRFELSRTTKGLVITDVDPEGVAAETGLQPGDVIQKVNGRDVTSTAELRDTLAKASDSKPALLLVSRGDQSRFVTLTPPPA
jgi:serine protease Do